MCHTQKYCREPDVTASKPHLPWSGSRFKFKVNATSAAWRILDYQRCRGRENGELTCGTRSRGGQHKWYNDQLRKTIRRCTGCSVDINNWKTIAGNRTHLNFFLYTCHYSVYNLRTNFGFLVFMLVAFTTKINWGKVSFNNFCSFISKIVSLRNKNRVNGCTQKYLESLYSLH